MNKQAVTRNEPSSLIREPALSREQRIQNLVNEMHACIETKRPIDLSTPPHIEITEALHHLVYEGAVPAKLQIIYSDGTRGVDFPVGTLRYPSTRLFSDKTKAFAIGTLTFRHVVYDDYVDRYLIRDRETRTMSNRDIEERAFVRMAEILEDPHMKKQSFLEIYHTGLEPLIVGLYRAVVEHLQVRRSSGLEQMTIQPIYYPVKKGESPEDSKKWANALGKLWG